MKLVLERFADNPIIDELIDRMNNGLAIKSLRACAPIWRKPFIEIEYRQSTRQDHCHFAKDGFIEYWSEATLVLETLTDIELTAEFKCVAPQNREATVEEILSARNDCIRECDGMFDSGLYRVFLDQFGPNCSDLPEDTALKIETARANLGRS